MCFFFRFDPDASITIPGGSLVPEGRPTLEFVGKFSKETHNTTIVDDVIYNFNTEEFDDERVVECCDTKTGTFSVLWKRDCPDWDFSPNYCLGCFPLVCYN